MLEPKSLIVSVLYYFSSIFLSITQATNSVTSYIEGAIFFLKEYKTLRLSSMVVLLWLITGLKGK